MENDHGLSKWKKFINQHKDLISSQKSSYWIKRTEEADFYNYKTYFNSGTFTERTFKRIIYNYLNQYLYFSNIDGVNILKTKTFKKTLEIAKKQNRVLDFDFLRMVFTYHFLIEIKKIKFSKICIIGDGKSNLTSIFRTINPDVKIYYINLVEAMMQDYQILSKSNLITNLNHTIVEKQSDLNIDSKIYFIPSFNANFIMKNKIDLFINIVSFQEMEPHILSNYFEIISSNKSILYHCNRHTKTLDGGDVVKLSDYPIGNGKIILDEQCPWHKFYYLPYVKKRYFGGVKEGQGIIHQIISYSNI